MTKVKGISVSLDMDTDKMQLKLRAIAKHTGALADELETIDKAETCNECGGLLNVSKLYVDGEETYSLANCERCS